MSPRLIPVFTSRGDVGAVLAYPYLFNPQGEWIGWVTADRTVFSVHGHYVGRLTDDPRVLRKRAVDEVVTQRTPPPTPPSLRFPASWPLAPQMAELAYSEFDVLEEEPERLPCVDSGELREDLD